jgi:drug/metabolite transporter (DMT)-like permease
MLCWAAYTVGSRPLLERHSPLVVTGFSMMIGSALYAPLGVPALLGLEWTAVRAWAWLLLVYSAVFALVVAYLIWYTAVQRVGNTRTSIYSNVVPLVAMAVAAIVLGEPMTARKFAGAAGVLAGVVLTRLELRLAADTPSEA